MDAVSHELVMELIRASRIRRAAEPGVPSTLSLAAWCRRAARADVDENEYRIFLLAPGAAVPRTLLRAVDTALGVVRTTLGAVAVGMPADTAGG